MGYLLPYRQWEGKNVSKKTGLHSELFFQISLNVAALSQNLAYQSFWKASKVFLQSPFSKNLANIF